MKVYISAPISMLNNEGLAFQRFEEIESKVSKLLDNIEIVNPMKIELHRRNKSKDYNRFMRVDLSYMLLCETVVFCDNFIQSKGCLWEYVNAKEFGISCVFLQEKEDKDLIVPLSVSSETMFKRHSKLMFQDKYRYLEICKK